MTFDRQAQRVDCEVALTPFDLFSGIIASWAAGFCRFDRLAVDDGHRPGGTFAFCPASRYHQNGDNLFPEPAVTPRVKAVLHRCIRWEVFRQIPPGTTAPDHIKQCVKYSAVVSRLASERLGVGQ